MVSIAQSESASFDFTERVAVVTGGTRGVGLAITLSLLAAGASVVICGRHEPEAPVAIAGPDGSERTAVFVEADVREAAEVTAVIDVACTHFGRLDILVNNAGGSPSTPAATASPRFAASIVALNLLAPLYGAQAANAVFQEQESGGVIVNIGSVSGMRPSPGAAVYGAAKAGLINLTETLAIEWAPKVRVNCLSAGLLDTGAGIEYYGGTEGLARVAATVPLGRMGTPADVAAACLFLASDQARFITGSNLVLHGGGEEPAFLEAARG